MNVHLHWLHEQMPLRELRGAGKVQVKWIPTDDNPADLFTKILSRQPFERHRKFVLNLSADAAVEQARVERQAKVDASSVREQTSKT